MKILVDTLPYFGSDCILFKRGECSISGENCPLVETDKAICPYLKAIESEETK